MMTKKILLLAFAVCTIAANSYSQTKKIAYKSHSGSAENYGSALNGNLFDMDNSNFGMAPTREIIDAKLDSVIFICDTVALMVTSRYCKKRNEYENSTTKEKLWSAGKDSVFYHPLFSKKHSLDSIKAMLEMQYYFKNPISKVVFVGYDNVKDTCKTNYPLAKASIPPSTTGGFGNSDTFNKQLVILFAGILLFASLITTLIWFSAVKNKTQLTIA
jgi:hypothetical protein